MAKKIRPNERFRKGIAQGQRIERYQALLGDIIIRFPKETKDRHVALLRASLDAEQVSWAGLERSIKYVEAFAKAMARVNRQMAFSARKLLKRSGLSPDDEEIIRHTQDYQQEILSLLEKIKKRREELGH